MSGINSCTFSGRAVADPEVHVAASGTMFVTLRIACDYDVFDSAAGSYAKNTVFVNMIAFGENAEYIRDNVARGTLVYASTQLNQTKYRDKTGKIRRSDDYRVIQIDAYDGQPKSRGWHSDSWI